MSANASIWSLVEGRAASTPDALLALDEAGRALTFGEYRARAESVAAGLMDIGVRPGTRVSWQLPTWLESFVLVGALCRIGAVQNPMLPIYRDREVGFVLREVQPAVFVVPSRWRGFDYEELAREVASAQRQEDGGACHVLVCDRALPEGDPSTLPCAPTDDDAVRWIFYTSGTTAAPKGALHTDATIVAGARGVVESFELTERDRYAVVFPFTHIGGVGMLVAQLLSGCGALVVEHFDVERTPVFLGANGLTVAAGGTPLAMLYLKHQREHPDRRVLPDVRVAMTGAAPKPTGLHAELRDELGGVGAVSVYGLTEAPFLTAGSVRDPDDKLATTEGRAVAGVELRVVADGEVCGPGEVGELRARGAVLCAGYLDASRNSDAVDADGFFRTGDLGSIDAEGYVTISGRLKDVIIRNGENIAATEVEDLLYGHPSVAEVAVVGLPDPSVGERCCAVVVARHGSTAPDVRELASWCRRAGLATQKWPERVELVDELPRNASGKVLKHELIARFT